MKSLFGTDGVRGRAGDFPMDGETVMALGRAWGLWICSRVSEESGSSAASPFVIIGKDTRESCDMLAAALASGLMQTGVDVMDGGILPTPAVAVMVLHCKASGGAVISASHNPFWDNGVKLFTQEGFKMTDSEEGAVMEIFNGQEKGPSEKTGRFLKAEDMLSRYMDFILKRAGEGASLAGLRLVLDTAHGAMYEAAPRVFEGLGAEVHVLAARPDGRNINAGVGSQHTEALSEKVREVGAHAGLAFDGDGDRLIAVDSEGETIRGDVLLAIFAHAGKKQGILHPSLLVTTVMSNLGLSESLRNGGIAHEMTAVGDRQVLARMRETGAKIGGEDSGHIIFLNPHCTGDGLFAAVRLARLIQETPLHEMARCMRIYPQVLINIPVREKPSLDSLESVQEKIVWAEKRLGSFGRILVRYSGTEPLCRVMVEAPTQEEAMAVCRPVEEAIVLCIGKR